MLNQQSYKSNNQINKSKVESTNFFSKGFQLLLNKLSLFSFICCLNAVHIIQIRVLTIGWNIKILLICLILICNWYKEEFLSNIFLMLAFVLQSFERAMKFSFEKQHVWMQFALSLISAGKVSWTIIYFKECLNL